MQGLIEEKNQQIKTFNRMQQQYGSRFNENLQRVVDQMSQEIDEFKGESSVNELIAAEVASEVVEKLKIAIERIEARM